MSTYPYTVQWENGTFVSHKMPHATATQALKGLRALYRASRARPFPSSIAAVIQFNGETVYYRYGADVMTNELVETIKAEKA